MTAVRVLILPKFADFENLLDYSVPANLVLKPGFLVSVPLGNRRVEALVVEMLESSEFPNLRPVGPVLDDSYPLSRRQIELARWLSIRSCSPLAGVLLAMQPPRGTSELQTRWRLAAQATGDGLPEKQARVLEYLQGKEPMLQAEIAAALSISTSPVKALIDKKILLPVQDLPALGDWNESCVQELTPDQDRVVQQAKGLTLLHGVTGSGKTEVYIRLARKSLNQGKQVLVLVPEIALTAQLVSRFRGAFTGQVAVLHSGLVNTVRREYWRRISAAEASVVIGTRSAVFAPFNNLGLIIMDEEHEPAYKQDETPRYHVRDVVLFLARSFGAEVVLGSATPSLESWHAANEGHLQLLELPRRIHDARPVNLSLVDMREQLASGNRSIFSVELADALAGILARGEQAILFLNRRGLAPTVLCRSCGFRFGCSSCSTTLALHRDGSLRCHHCGFRRGLPSLCPQCRGDYLRELGLGTQRLEQQVLVDFPGSRVLRLDRDTVTNSRHREQVLLAFHRREADILLGTQMVAKGLDFPKVTLVGIMLADLSLAVADFRAAERTFQLVTQAGGRTGRGEHPGRVIIQTYQPEHYSLQYALAEDYRGFAARELDYRKAARMPPWSNLSRIVLSSSHKPPDNETQVVVRTLAEVREFAIINWGPAPLERYRGRFRNHVVISHNGARQAREKLDLLRRDWAKLGQVRITVDNDPYNFM